MCDYLARLGKEGEPEESMRAVLQRRGKGGKGEFEYLAGVGKEGEAEDGRKGIKEFGENGRRE